MLDCGVMGGFKFAIGKALAGIVIGSFVIGVIVVGYLLKLYIDEGRKK